MKCPECQFKNRERVKFCENCGAKFDVKCPNCEAEIPSDIKYCGECGFKLTDSQEISLKGYNEPKSYTPKSIAEKIITSRSLMEGERKLVTVLFADVANYTSIAEKLDPEEIYQVMDGCFRILLDQVHRYEGTVNQFTGDGIMALFGAPLAHEDHAQRACYTALAIQAVLSEYSEELYKSMGIDFKVRIGLNSGEVVVGTIGDDLFMDYTAIGDTVNLASRMESSATPGNVFLSENTYRLSKDYFEMKPIGELNIKGKAAPQKAWHLLKTSDVHTRIAASVAKGLTRFVGRKRELGTIKNAYYKAMSGKGQVVGIFGEAGVGKSRLLLELINQLPINDQKYLEGKCLNYGSRITYLPIIDILKSYFIIKKNGQGISAHKIVKDKISQINKLSEFALPSIQDLFNFEVENDKYLHLDTSQKKLHIFKAVRNLFYLESEQNPLIISIEDLHWIDKTSEELINQLINELYNKRILLILLFRLEYNPQWGSKPYYNEIELTQLSRASSKNLVKAIFEENIVSPELNELIINRTDGNPLFAEELTQSLIEKGSIRKKNNEYILSEELLDTHVPDTIQGLIASRIDRIEEKHKKVLQVASVIGREFAFRVIRSISDVQEEIKNYLVNLQRLEFIYEKKFLPELEYIFKHALTQEVIYNSLLKEKKKEIHERIGNAIETIYSKQAEDFYELLAYHYMKSDNRDKAINYLYLACQKAMKFNAMNEAMEYFQEAMKLIDNMPDSETNQTMRISLIVDQWPAFLMLFKFSEHYDLLNLYEPIAKKSENKELLGQFYNRKGHIEWWFGKFNDSIGNRSKALEIFKSSNNIRKQANAYIGLEWDYMFKDDYDKVFELRDKTLHLMEKHIFPYEYVYAVLGACYAYSNMGRWEESLNEAREGIKIARKFSDNSLLAVAALHMSRTYIIKGDIDKATEHAEMALEKAPTPADQAWAQSILAWAWSLSEQLDKAIEFWEGLAPLMKAVQYQPGAIQVLILLGQGYLLARNFDKAKKTLEECADISKRYEMNLYLGRSHYLLAEINIESDPKRAENYLNNSVLILSNLKAIPFLARAYSVYGKYYTKQGQTKNAIEYLNKALSLFEQLGAIIEVERYKKEISYLQKILNNK